MNKKQAQYMKFSMMFLVFILLTGIRINAQNVRFFVDKNQITTDEGFSLSAEITQFSGRVGPPPFPHVTGLHAMGTSSRQSWVNGVASFTFSQTYYPQKTGTFKIPSFSYVVGKKSFNSPEFTVKVTKGTGKPKQQKQNDPFANFFGNDPFWGGGNQQPKQLNYKETQADYFLSVNLDKEECFVGEKVRGEVVLYINERDYGKINVDGLAIMEMQQRIKNTGFWQEIFEFDQIPVNKVQVNGKNYIAYTMYRTILFPLNSGDIEFKDIYLDGKKLYVATNASPFDAFFGKNVKFEPIKIRASQRKLKVRPLPPTDLKDAMLVGNFTMKGKLDKSTAETGENVEMTVTIKGDGNIAMMPEPVVSIPEEFESSEASIQFNTNKDERSYFGEKTFTYNIVPRKSGTYNLGPVKFYYFNQKRKAYDSLEVERLPLAVTGEDLDDLKLRQSGLQSFYETAFTVSSEAIRHDRKGTKVILLTGLLLFSGAIGFVIFRNKRTGEEEIEEKDNFWD